MRKHVAMVATVLTMMGAGVAKAYEYNDGNIVISDNWCAPYNDGNCFTCNSGHLVVSATCTSSYCDNMIYHCQNPPVVAGQQVSISGLYSTMPQFSGWVSSADGSSSTAARCPAGYAMVGMNSTGDYSDKIRTICQAVSRPGGFSGSGATPVIQQNTAISEEAPNTYMSVGSSGWLLGAACSGTHCDNMYYWFETFI